MLYKKGHKNLKCHYFDSNILLILLIPCSKEYTKFFYCSFSFFFFTGRERNVIYESSHANFTYFLSFFLHVKSCHALVIIQNIAQDHFYRTCKKCSSILTQVLKNLLCLLSLQKLYSSYYQMRTFKFLYKFKVARQKSLSVSKFHINLRENLNAELLNNDKNFVFTIRNQTLCQ